MIIKQIYSRRNERGQNYAQPIIFEWEDVISEIICIPVVKYPFIARILNRIKFDLPFLPLKNTFRFVTNGGNNDKPMNNKHIIPCIIDFFEKGVQLQEFYTKHSKNKVILVSSPYDYHYLKENKCPLRIELFPYSISDKWAIINKQFEKKYDIVLTGRQDPLLYSFFKEYIKKHPNVTFVKRGKDINNDDRKTKDYYLNGKVNLGPVETRDEFMRLQSQGRVTLYGVQGYDNDTEGFYHMTPHFLEIIACGCHVLMHYPTDKYGIDAKYYEFSRFSPSIETYKAFETSMDFALKTDVDIDMYATYLNQHYTSNRVKQLRVLLKNLS